MVHDGHDHQRTSTYYHVREHHQNDDRDDHRKKVTQLPPVIPGPLHVTFPRQNEAPGSSAHESEGRGPRSLTSVYRGSSVRSDRIRGAMVVDTWPAFQPLGVPRYARSGEEADVLRQNPEHSVARRIPRGRTHGVRSMLARARLGGRHL